MSLGRLPSGNSRAQESTAEKPLDRLPIYEAPDLGHLAIHLLNKLPSEEDQTDTDKALVMVFEILKGLVGGLQGQFTMIDTVIEDVKQHGGGGGGAGAGGEGEKKKNPYAVIQGNFQGENFQTKMQEQESRLHEMTVQYMHLTGRVEQIEVKVQKLETLAADTEAKTKKLLPEVKQLHMEAPVVGERINQLYALHTAFVEKIEPKFVPLENDVSVINAVLQLDKQNFVSKNFAGMLTLTSPLFTSWDQRLDSLESDSGDLQKKVRDWCEGCDELFAKLSRSRIAQSMGQSILGAQRANRKGSRAVSFGGGEEAEESNSSALDLGVGFQIRDLGKCLYFFQSVLNQMSTMEEMIKQWEVFHQSIETRIDEHVVRHIDQKISGVLEDPRHRQNAIKLIHALSPNAEYQQVLTQLDMKVDKQQFQTFTAKFYEKVEGLAKLSSLQGQVLGEVRDTVFSDEREGVLVSARLNTAGHSKDKQSKDKQSKDKQKSAGTEYGHITHRDITKLQPHRSIQTSTTSSETFKQAHLRLPKPPAVIPTGQSQNWSEKFGSPWYSRGGRPNSART